MVAVYTVGARKEIPDVRTYVSLDGGMADNIRPAMYGSKYEAISVDRPLADTEELVTLAGKYCESGDILVENASLRPDSRGVCCQEKRGKKLRVLGHRSRQRLY